MCMVEKSDRKSQENESQWPLKHLTFPWQDSLKNLTLGVIILEQPFDKCEE